MSKAFDSATGPAKRGRPTEIDPTSVAFGSAAAFWRFGYDGASIDNLVDAAGVSRPGLYRTFGDKQALFLAAIDAYEERVTRQAVEAFEAETEIARSVEAFLSVSARNNTNAQTPTGCMIICCAIASAEEIPSVRTKVADSFESLEERIAARFGDAVKNSALSQSPAPRVRARLLLDMMVAQAVRARAGASYEALIADLGARTAAVLADNAVDARRPEST